MDACLAVDCEVDKVLLKFRDIRQSYNKVLQQLIDDLETMKNDLQKNNTNYGKVFSLSNLNNNIQIVIGYNKNQATRTFILIFILLNFT